MCSHVSPSTIQTRLGGCLPGCGGGSCRQLLPTAGAAGGGASCATGGVPSAASSSSAACTASLSLPASRTCACATACCCSQLAGAARPRLRPLLASTSNRWLLPASLSRSVGPRSNLSCRQGRTAWIGFISSRPQLPILRSPIGLGRQDRQATTSATAPTGSRKHSLHQPAPPATPPPHPQRCCALPRFGSPVPVTAWPGRAGRAWWAGPAGSERVAGRAPLPVGAMPAQAPAGESACVPAAVPV